MAKTWTEEQISSQRQRVTAAAPNGIYYERGRLDCMLGNVVPIQGSSIEQLQWEEGWRHEHLDIPRPF